MQSSTCTGIWFMPPTYFTNYPNYTYLLSYLPTYLLYWFNFYIIIICSLHRSISLLVSHSLIAVAVSSIGISSQKTLWCLASVSWQCLCHWYTTAFYISLTILVKSWRYRFFSICSYCYNYCQSQLIGSIILLHLIWIYPCCYCCCRSCQSSRFRNGKRHFTNGPEWT